MEDCHVRFCDYFNQVFLRVVKHHLAPCTINVYLEKSKYINPIQMRLYLTFLLATISFLLVAQVTSIDTLSTNVSGPVRIKANPDGTALFLTAFSDVLRFDLATATFDTFYQEPTINLSGPGFVGEEFYFTRFSSGNSVLKFNPNFANPDSEVVATGLGNINGLVSVDSVLYLTASNTNVLWRLDLTDDMPVATQVLNTGLNFPGPISHSDGQLYISDIASDNIVQVDLGANPIVAAPVTTVDRPISSVILDDRLIVTSLDDDLVLSYALADFSLSPDTLLEINRPGGMTNIGNDLYIHVDDNTLVRLSLELEGEDCNNAFDVNSLFGQEIGVAQTSALYDNTDYDAEGDPEVGFECFQDGPSLNHTIWFTFTGDGNSYEIKTVQCNATDYIDFGDTQLAIYSGDCGNLAAVLCNENQAGGGSNDFEAGVEFPTEVGVEYRMLIDGFPSAASDAKGEFCLEVTQLGPSSVANIQDTPIQLFPNPTSGILRLEAVAAARVAIFNQLGSQVATFMQPGNQLDISEYPTGVYLLRIEDADGELFSARVVKQ